MKFRKSILLWGFFSVGGASNTPPSLNASRASRGHRERTPAADGTLKKGPFRGGTKIFTSRKRCRAPRRARRRTFRSSSFLRQTAQSKRKGFNIFRTLTSQGPQNFPIPTLCWRVLARTSGQNDLSVSDKSSIARAVRAPKGAQRHELSMPQGNGLTRQTKLFFRIFSRPRPIWTGPFFCLPYASGPFSLDLRID